MIALAATSGAARADSSAPGAAALARARASWDKGEFDKAEKAYKEALDQGGLSPVDTLDCYVHLGTARSITGHATQALIAFRQAALISPTFAPPPEAGKKALGLVTRAKREAQTVGTYAITGASPFNVPANKPFTVDVTLDAANVAIVNKVGVFVFDDGRDDREFRAEEAAGTSVHFEVPGSMAVPKSTLVVRFDALDSHANRVASVERRVRVNDAENVAPPPVLATTPGPDWSKEPPKPVDHDKGSKKGGFWSSPWPYLIGGVALAAGGAALYIYTRPADQVTVDAARVNVR